MVWPPLFYLKDNGAEMATSASYIKWKGNGMATSPLSLKGNVDGMATSAFYLEWKKKAMAICQLYLKANREGRAKALQIP